MQSPSSDASPRRPGSRWKLWLLIAICAAPIIGSYIAYYVWQPSGHVNYGELLEPRLVPDTGLQSVDGTPFRFSELKGQWTLLVAEPAQCGEDCRTRLTYMRQVRLAQGRETKRIERVWLLTDDATPAASLLAEHPGLRVVRAPGSDVLQTLPASAESTSHIFVVDPLGHLMMRFPADPDPRRMLKDVSRLLRHSKWK